MFISTSYLVKNYGIDEKIARFFVDREPPPNNLYWHGKLLYLRHAPGYLFIPLIVDLLSRIGIEKKDLLSEEFVTLMEKVGHISALEETNEITDKEATTKCTELVKDAINQTWLRNVVCYFNGNENNTLDRLTTPFKALHRGDYFLFCLCALHFEERLFTIVAKLWFALISTLLLLDDAEDISGDKDAGEVNAFIESGLSGKGLKQINALVDNNIETMSAMNPVMANELKRQCTERFKMSDIATLVNC
jgi:hypothetical protein